MSKHVSVKWKCDRCDAETTVYADGRDPEPPFGWSRNNVTEMVRDVPLDRPDDLCADCTLAYVTWFNEA